MSLPPILTDTREIAEFAEELAGCPVIAVDLEADSMHNYQEKVCLLQFSTPATTVLIDPLAGGDLVPLQSVLANPAIRKIFHAADYDIRCLARDFSIQVRGLFDTMISCQFIGEERFGLADILRKYFAVELDKQFQRADWSQRPLSAGMIRYAAEDTGHLHPLAEMLEGKLLEKGRLEWVQEECALLEKVRFAVHDGPEFLRFKGAGTLSRRQLAILESLLQWRDTEAQRRDCPLYKVLGNKPLLELARLMPQGRKQLAGIEGLPPRLTDRYGGQLLHAISRALDLPDSALPIFPKGERREKDPQAERRLTLLKNWRKKAAAALELDPGVLISNAVLEELARRRPVTERDLEQVSLLKNWQRKELGKGILQALN